MPPNDALREAVLFLLGEVEHGLMGDLFAGTVPTHVAIEVTLDAAGGGPGTYKVEISI